MANGFTPLFIGTCRVHDPAHFIKAEGYNALVLPERYHSPQQILKTVRHLAGIYNYPINQLHTVSDLTIEKILKGDTLEDIQRELDQQRDRWNRATHIVIEISTRKEFYYTRKDKVNHVNTFFERDIENYSKELAPFYESNALLNIKPNEIQSSNSSEARIKTVMNQIKILAKDKKILWVSHISPSVYSETLNYLVEQRRSLSATQGVIADQLGDRFFDPSVTAKQLGDDIFFKNSGMDVNHMTDVGAELLSKHYLELLESY